MAQFTVNPTRFDPYKDFKFRVKWDGHYVAGISNTNSRCSRPMCGVAAGLSRPSKHLIRLAFTMRSSPHNVGHHESRFPSLGITRVAMITILFAMAAAFNLFSNNHGRLTCKITLGSMVQFI